LVLMLGVYFGKETKLNKGITVMTIPKSTKQKME